jgi:hypothetical protein
MIKFKQVDGLTQLASDVDNVAEFAIENRNLINNKINKLSSSTIDNIVTVDNGGTIKDSLKKFNDNGISSNDIFSDSKVINLLEEKADKLTIFESGNIITLDSNGGIQDSSKKFNDEGNSINDIWSAVQIQNTINNVLGANDAMILKGGLDCSSNPNYPAASAGWTYKITVSGKIGGSSGINVEIGDIVICYIDNSPSGDHTTVGNNWFIVQNNIDGAVISLDTSSINGQIVVENGISGKIIKKSLAIIDSNGSINIPSGQHFKINGINLSATDIGGEPTLDKGNLTESTSSVLIINGGTDAIIGSGLTIQVKQASSSQSGYLSSTDWNTFNNKVDSENPTFSGIAKFGEDGTTCFIVGQQGIPTIPGTNAISQWNNSDGAYSDWNFNVASNGYPVINFISTGGTLLSPAISSANGFYGEVRGWGYADTYRLCGRIAIQKDGTPSLTSLPSKIVFFTTPVGSLTPVAIVTIDNAGNVTGITKVMVGLGNVDNTSDMDKPISTATAASIATREPLLGKGNLTEIGSSILTINGGTDAIIGSGLTIQVKQASGSQSGYLSSTDWNTFNNKQNSSANLSALSNLNSTAGIIVQTAANTFTKRTISAGSSKISINNGDGILNNPTIDIIESNLTLVNIGGDLPQSRITNLTSNLLSKADKILSPINDNIVTMDASGNIINSGKKFNDSGLSTNDVLSASKIYELLPYTAASSTKIEASLSASQTISNSTWTKIRFNNQIKDTLNEYDNVTNFRFTAINAGRYLINCIVSYTHHDSGYRILTIFKNGTDTDIKTVVEPNTQSNQNISFGLNYPLDLQANDYIEIFTWQNRGNTLDIITSPKTILSITRIG